MPGVGKGERVMRTEEQDLQVAQTPKERLCPPPGSQALAGAAAHDKIPASVSGPLSSFLPSALDQRPLLLTPPLPASVTGSPTEGQGQALSTLSPVPGSV